MVRNVASVSTTICMPQTSKRVLPQSDKPPQGMHNHRFPPNPIGPGSDSRIVGITGHQSLPACVRLLSSDVSWGDQQIVHKGRSPMSYDSFSRTFRPI